MSRKYLEYFNGAFDSTVVDKRQPDNKPYVAYSKTDGVVYTVIPEPADPTTYVTFTAQQDNSSIGLKKLSTNQTLKYSTDTITWNTFDTTTNISLNKGDKVYVRGVLSADNNIARYTQFKMTGKIAASGNCNAIWNYQDLNAPLKAYCGYCMFYQCTSLTTAPQLPATTLTNGCYCQMFDGCSSLTTSPELPATTLVRECYYGMFYGCSSLTTAPELPATTLADWCYTDMFSGCTKLHHITCLATDISAYQCTFTWVNNVLITGTFIKHPDMHNWPTGTSGIPSKWTVVNAIL